MTILLPPGMNHQPAAIAAGQAISAEIDLGGQTLCGIYLPANWTPAALTFQVTPDGANWFEHYAYSGSETVYGGGAGSGCYVAIDPMLWRGVASLKIRSGTAAAPIIQVAAAALNLAVRLAA